MLTKYIAATETRFQSIETKLEKQEASTQELKDQIGQITKILTERPQGRLPSNTETNPREQIQAISTHDNVGLDEPHLRQENVVEEGKVEE